MIWGFLAAAATTGLLMPLVLHLLRDRRILDVPNARSGHTITIPRGGGLACAAGIALGGLAAQELGGVDLPMMGLAFVGGMAVLGFLDDVVDLSALLRLVVQVGCGAALGWWFGNLGFIVLGVVVLVWLVNVTNFMDGINGLTAVIAILWGATAWWSGTYFKVEGLAVIGALCAGAALGFLPWNFPRPRVFIGDVGAYLLGSMYAVGIMASLQHAVFTDEAIALSNQALRATAVAAGPLLIYLADTTVAIVRMLVRGENPMKPHRRYTFHRLVDLAGWPHWFMTGVILLLSMLVTAAVIFLPDVYAVMVAGLIVLLYLGLPTLVRDYAQRRPAPQDQPSRRA